MEELGPGYYDADGDGAKTLSGHVYVLAVVISAQGEWVHHDQVPVRCSRA